MSKESNREAALRRYHRRKTTEPDKVRAEGAASSRAYYARIRASGGELHERIKEASRERTRRWRGEGEWHLILRSDPCCYCGKRTEQIDHIVPIVRGGSSEWDNLTASCIACNRRKRDKSLLLFLLNR